MIATSTPKKFIISCLFVIGFTACGIEGGRPANTDMAENENEIEILQKTEKTENLEGDIYRTIHVQVKNNSSELQDYVEVKATWYDKSGKIVGTGMGNTTNLSSGSVRVIDVQGTEIDNADHYELETSTSPI